MAACKETLDHEVHCHCTSDVSQSCCCAHTHLDLCCAVLGVGDGCVGSTTRQLKQLQPDCRTLIYRHSLDKGMPLTLTCTALSLVSVMAV